MQTGWKGSAGLFAILKIQTKIIYGFINVAAAAAATGLWMGAGQSEASPGVMTIGPSQACAVRTA